MSEEYKAGSEGSKVCAINLRKYPAVGELDEHSASETQHPMRPPKREAKAPAENETTRRTLNVERDKTHRWGVGLEPTTVEKK